MTGTPWQQLAACAAPQFEGHRDLWFPHASDVLARKAAQRVCALCPVRIECLNAALEAEGGRAIDSRYGIYGGLTEGQRVALYRRLRKPVNA